MHCLQKRRLVVSPKPYNYFLERNACLPQDFIQLFSSFDSLDLDICFSLFKSFFKNWIQFSHIGTCLNFHPETVLSAREQMLRKFTAQSPATSVGKAPVSPAPLEKTLQEEDHGYERLILGATFHPGSNTHHWSNAKIHDI